MAQRNTSQQSGAETTGPDYNMIDVGAKKATHRTATAEGLIHMDCETFKLMINKQIPKGDCLALAEIAGILAAKKTSSILPLCHPLPLEKISVVCKPESDTHSIRVTGTVSTHGKTGVEMEALSGVQGALLCIYDLCKPHDPRMVIDGIRLLEKHGGKHGSWYVSDDARNLQKIPRQLWKGISVCLLTVSDRSSRGIRQDRSGPELATITAQFGGTVLNKSVVGDEKEEISGILAAWIEDLDPDCILISGGTGPASRDVTPEVLKDIADKEMNGIGEALRKEGAANTPFSWLSRSTAVIKRNSLVIALPGSPKAVREGLEVLYKLVPHTVDLVRERDDPHNPELKEKP